MYQCAEICLPRKKRIPETFHSNTYRIFDENAPERLDPCKAYNFHAYPRRSAEECAKYKTRNIPQPRNIKFISSNVRWLNAPISLMATEDIKGDRSDWWPSGCEEGVRHSAPYSRDSVQRRDFQPAPTATRPAPGVGATPTQPPAYGIIPAISPKGHQNPLLERISFIHQYNSRKLQDQPYQGKRHGAFVWSEIKRAGGGAHS